MGDSIIGSIQLGPARRQDPGDEKESVPQGKHSAVAFAARHATGEFTDAKAKEEKREKEEEEENESGKDLRIGYAERQERVTKMLEEISAKTKEEKMEKEEKKEDENAAGKEEEARRRRRRRRG